MYYKNITFIGVFAINSNFLPDDLWQIGFQTFAVIIAATAHSYLVVHAINIKFDHILVTHFDRGVEQNIIVGRMQSKKIAIYRFKAG